MAFGRRGKSKSEGGPKAPGKIAQARQGYTAVKQLDPQIGRWMAGAFALTLLVVVAFGWRFGHIWYSLFLGLPLAALAATFLMNRRANKAMYGAMRGRPGAAGMTLSQIRNRGWYLSQEPVAVDANRSMDMANSAMVFRALGRPGVVLVGEGPKGRAHKLIEAERKKVGRVAPGVPVHVFTVGEAEDDVPIDKLQSKVTRLKPTLTKDEVSVVNKRLKSLPGLRQQVPGGVDPNRVRMDRKSMRGR